MNVPGSAQNLCQGQGCREWEHDSLEMLTGKAPEVDTLPEQLMVTQLKIVSTARGRTWQHSFFLDLFGFCSLFVAYSLHTFVGPGHELKPSHIAIRIFSS